MSIFSKFNDYTNGHPRVTLLEPRRQGARQHHKIIWRIDRTLWRRGMHRRWWRLIGEEQLIILSPKPSFVPLRNWRLPHQDGGIGPSSICTVSSGPSVTREGSDAKLEMIFSGDGRIAPYLANAWPQIATGSSEPISPVAVISRQDRLRRLKDAINRISFPGLSRSRTSSRHVDKPSKP